MNKYVYRLLREWIDHEKIVIAVDYDDTLYPYALGNDKDRTKAISAIKNAQALGAYVVVFTASNNSRHPEIEEFCGKIGLHIDSINKNPIPLPYGNEGKIYYNINLCDRSGLRESTKILTKTMKLYASSVS